MMTKSQKQDFKEEGTNNRDKIASIEENELVDATITKKFTNTDDKLVEDGKRR
jgi:hypothetical protein